MVMAPSAITTTYNETCNSKHYIDNLNLITHYDGVESNEIESVGSKQAVLDVLKKQIAKVKVDSCQPGEEDAFYVADLGEVYRQHLRWKLNLGSVKPFYGMVPLLLHVRGFTDVLAAVKCNPDDKVLRLLAKLGTGFDCASQSEIERVLKLGVDPARIIYAQPCKTKSYIRYAAKVGVKQMTFDNADELHKIRAFFPDAELVLRILTDDSASLCRLSAKFGASLDKTEGLLGLAKSLGLNVTGVSFHVGSGASDPASFTKAVQDARMVFDQATAAGFDLKLLDVGGGFVDETFETFASALREALEDHFPPHVRIIGEPGRYYVANAFTLATNIIARRDVHDSLTEQQAYMIYLNDGVYGNFSNIIFDHQHPSAKILACGDDHQTPTEYSIWGPTCDGIDVITERCTLPGVLEVGDWLFFEEMGAYTKCSATRFNGFPDDHEVIYVSSEPGALALLRG